MDFKELLAPDTYIRVEYRNGNSECVSADYFFQAIKARLIEVLKTADTIVQVDEDCSVMRPGVRLIDTMEPSNER